MFYVRVFLVGVFTMVLNPCLGRQSRSEGRGMTSSSHSLPRSQQPGVMTTDRPDCGRSPFLRTGVQDGRTERLERVWGEGNGCAIAQ